MALLAASVAGVAFGVWQGNFYAAIWMFSLLLTLTVVKTVK